MKKVTREWMIGYRFSREEAANRAAKSAAKRQRQEDRLNREWTEYTGVGEKSLEQIAQEDRLKQRFPVDSVVRERTPEETAEEARALKRVLRELIRRYEQPDQ